MGPKISVIVPVYKVEAYLDRCISSIAAQTYDNLEIILIDDGSPDQCPRMCDDWAQKDSRIRVLHKENEGVAKARNLGLEVASGEYVMFVDSDDYLPLDAVQVLLERLLSDGSDMAVGKTIQVDEDGREDGSYSDFIRDRLFTGEDFLCAMGSEEHYDVGPCAKLYTRKALAGIRFPAMTCGEDMWVFPLIVLQCTMVSVVDAVVYFYFQRADSVMHTTSDRQNMESVRATQHMTEIFMERNHPACAGCWFGFGVQYIQEMEDKQRGVELMKELFTGTQIKQLLRHAGLTIRVKWFLLQHLRVYNLVFGIKQKLLG